MTNTLDNLTPSPQPAKSSVVEPRVWQEVRNKYTGRLIGKYCPQTHQFESVDRGKRDVIELPHVVK